ncbi:Uncharacterised protein [Mycobacteroides abscessus subsp. abscessus]|nr:Uncharacterised protein [Mycobacteroides abscessus subsp. abscessus]
MQRDDMVLGLIEECGTVGIQMHVKTLGRRGIETVTETAVVDGMDELQRKVAPLCFGACPGEGV